MRKWRNLTGPLRIVKISKFKIKIQFKIFSITKGFIHFIAFRHLGLPGFDIVG